MISGIGGISGSPAPYRPQAPAGGREKVGLDGLTDEQKTEVAQLRRRDAEVRAHEQAHAAVGGAYAGAPRYEYEKGPDGQRYAVGGEVSIDTSPEKSPQETITKMEIVKRAALAPAEPSPQDRKVAALADQQRLEAQAQLFEQRAAEQEARLAESDAAREKAKADAGSPNGQDTGGGGNTDRRVEAANRRAAQAYERVAAINPDAAPLFRAVA